jgi:hypothetical protein
MFTDGDIVACRQEGDTVVLDFTNFYDHLVRLRFLGVTRLTCSDEMTRAVVTGERYERQSSLRDQ